ncbi:MAG: AbrB/MazE/SpoVT family DNA-binding domain-containing protein [Rhodanobacter sp.]|jgi:AbrB family looped-hinge helix DNA binding protein|nr:AbrB/MazE/SpoVT family DNA-binding domain-containing protein [Rhodanobacter sp.]
MQTMMTSKGQVTIPKRVRDELGLMPGNAVEFEANAAGEVVIRKPAIGKRVARDRFDQALGSATVKWGSTEKLMALLRPDDE